MISESFNTLISSYSEEKEKLFDSLNSFQSMLKEYMVVKENYSKNQGNLTKMHPLKQFETLFDQNFYCLEMMRNIKTLLNKVLSVGGEINTLVKKMKVEIDKEEMELILKNNKLVNQMIEIENDPSFRTIQDKTEFDLYIKNTIYIIRKSLAYTYFLYLHIIN